MKKLMFVAAATAMTSAALAAGLCDWGKTSQSSCFAWHFRANVKTLVPQKITVSAAEAAICEWDVPAGAACNYLVAGVRQFSGIFWTCSSPCPADDIARGDVYTVIWENSSKLPITMPLFTNVYDPMLKAEGWYAQKIPANYWTDPEVKGYEKVEIDSEDHYLPVLFPYNQAVFDRFGFYATAAEAFWPFKTDLVDGEWSVAENNARLLLMDRKVPYRYSYDATLYTNELCEAGIHWQELYWGKLPGFTIPANMKARYDSYTGAYGGQLYLAGFGAFASTTVDAGNFQTINGYCTACWKPECGPVKADFCSTLTSWCDRTTNREAQRVAGYGVWSLSYNADLSSGRRSLVQIIPARSQVTTKAVIPVEDPGTL